MSQLSKKRLCKSCNRKTFWIFKSDFKGLKKEALLDYADKPTISWISILLFFEFILLFFVTIWRWLFSAQRILVCSRCGKNPLGIESIEDLKPSETTEETVKEEVDLSGIIANPRIHHEPENVADHTDLARVLNSKSDSENAIPEIPKEVDVPPTEKSQPAPQVVNMQNLKEPNQNISNPASPPKHKKPKQMLKFDDNPAPILDREFKIPQDSKPRRGRKPKVRSSTNLNDILD